jgi:hypothetical protein
VSRAVNPHCNVNTPPTFHKRHQLKELAIMATQNATTARNFTRWHQEIDGTGLILCVDNPDGSIAEWIDMNILDLPARADLIERMPERMRERVMNQLLPEARSRHIMESLDACAHP